MTPSANTSPREEADEVLDLRKFFFRMISNWYYFAATIFIALLLAYLYNKFTLPVYRTTSTILIEEDKKSALPGTEQLLQGFGLNPGMQNLDNQILILSSWSLIGRTLDSVHFDVEYYYKGYLNKSPLYPDHPVIVIPDEKLPRDIEFSITLRKGDKFTIKSESDINPDFKKEASFGEKIDFGGGSFIVADNRKNVPGHKNEIYFTIHSREQLTESYSRRLKVQPASREATIVRLTLEGTNRMMDMDFLNKLTENFLNYNLDKKNKEANRTIEFIDKQLVGISDSLAITEENLQRFRSKNMVMNLSAQGQVIIEQAMNLENEKAKLVIESNYYNYLADYLSKDNIGEVPIAPATMGITDPGLTKLVMDLTELQGQFYSKSLGEKNPMQAQLAQKLKNTKDALKETLNGVKHSNELALKENIEQIHAVNSKASALPVTERQLLGIERQFKLNDVLYTFLLEKKSEAQIQKASNSPDNEVIDIARTDKTPVSPKTALAYLIAFIGGLGFPFIYIMIADLINFKIRDEEDIKKITDVPIAGFIPHNKLNSQIVMFEDPNSHSAEAFRSLRSRMQFFIKETKSPVILITSSMPAEGKTYTAINLASAYSIMGKKTVLVGFDLRKPKIFNEFGITNEKGVSTWLIGNDSLDDVLRKSNHENLCIIPAGPIPPNPSELTSSFKTSDLLRILKEKFDYVIIDSPPIGSVSDTFHLATLADACLLIVRQNKTVKNFLEGTINDLKVSSINNTSLVINDIGLQVNGYGYGVKYGYNKSYKIHSS